MECDEDGYELAARFSYITNALTYCGPKEDHKEFYKYITEVKSERTDASKKNLYNSIKRFEALYPYLKFIAAKSGKDILDYEVVQAYWIGNSLLDRFSKEDMGQLVDILTSRGLPKSLAEKLKKNMPEGALPYHTFHVLYVGVGNVTGHVKTNLRNMDNCRISAGRIIEIIDNHLIVETDSLVEKDGKISLIYDENKTVIYDSKIILSPNIGDIVAIHWGFACKKISEKESAAIKKYTKLALDAKNSVY